MVLGATALTALIESALAVAFLWPGRGALAALRDPLLLVFCAGTYALVPVPGFGWLLLAIGIAQCPAERRVLRGLYVGAFVLLILYGALPGRRTLGPPAPPHDGGHTERPLAPAMLRPERERHEVPHGQE